MNIFVLTINQHISIRNYVVRNIILNNIIFIDMNSLYIHIYIYIGLYKINQIIQCALFLL